MATAAQALNQPLASPVVPSPKMPPPAPSMQPVIDQFKDASQKLNAASNAEAAGQARYDTANAAVQSSEAADIRGAYAKEQTDLGSIDAQMQPFKPTQDTIKTMIPLFAMVGMLAAGIGGKRSSMAGQNAQAALTGMVQGWNKGQADVVAQQKTIYDENVKYLQDTAKRVKDAFADYKDNVIKFGNMGEQAEKLRQELAAAGADLPALKLVRVSWEGAEKVADDGLKIAKEVDAQNERAFRDYIASQDLELKRKAAGENGGLTDETKTFFAQNFLTTGQMPALGMGSAGVRTAILNEAAQLARESGISGSDLAGISAGYVSGKTALTMLTKQYDAASSNENAMLANMKVAEKAEPDAQKSALPFLNKWLQTGSTSVGMAGAPAYATAIVTVADKYAKILSGSTGAAPASDASRAQAFQIINQYLNQGQIGEVFNIMRQDTDNTKKGYQDQIAEQKKSLVGGANQGGSSRPTEARPDYQER